MSKVTIVRKKVGLPKLTGTKGSVDLFCTPVEDQKLAQSPIPAICKSNNAFYLPKSILCQENIGSEPKRSG